MVRMAVLPLPGTRDMGVWKIWTYYAARHSPATMYGVGGTPPERRSLNFHGAETTVDVRIPLAEVHLGIGDKMANARADQGSPSHQQPRLDQA